MYCPQCGTQNDNSALFCKNCGKNLEGVAAKAETPAISYKRNEKTTNEISSIKLADDPVINAVKKLVLSPLNFVATIAFSIVIILTISNAEDLVTSFLKYFDDIGGYGIYSQILYDYELDNTLDAFSGFFRLLATIKMLPQIVIGIGMWLTIFTSFRKGDDFSLSGIKAIKVINVISFVFSIIVLIVSTGFFIWAIKNIYDIYQTGYMYVNNNLLGFIFILMFICVCIICFNIYYKKQILNVINCFISTVNGRTPYVPGKFVAVMCFIGCGGYVVSGIMYSNVITWCSAIAFFCFGLLIIKTGDVLKPLRPKSRLLNEFENSDAVANEQPTEV